MMVQHKKSCSSARAVALLCLIGAVDAFTGRDVPRTRPFVSRCRRDHVLLFQGQSSSISPQPVQEMTTESNYMVASSPVIIDVRDNSNTMSKTTREVAEEAESVPSTWSHALQRFFIQEPGPPLVLLSISGFVYNRIQSSIPFSISELSIFASSIIIWWIQEYVFHRILLHSAFQWIGKSIHQKHHGKKYFHISIDPPELLLGWLFTAHFVLKSILPWNFCLSATIGYALAGLVYEWSHYIVHTKVRPPSAIASSGTLSLSETLARLFSQMRDNHMRHHLVDDRYWYAFSVPAMDDLFDTNPNVKEVRKMHGSMR